MQPDEQWRSFSRHHRAVEVELEALRVAVALYQKQFRKLAELFPSLELEQIEIPERTPEWRGETYRDADRKFPPGITEHLDWLDKSDY